MGYERNPARNGKEIKIGSRIEWFYKDSFGTVVSELKSKDDDGHICWVIDLDKPRGNKQKEISALNTELTVLE